MTEFHIGEWTPDKRVYAIAEAGLAHLGSMDLAMLMVEQAKEAGADAVKFQAFGPDLKFPFPECQRRRLDSGQLSDLQNRAREIGLDFLCTPHDKWGLDILGSLYLPAIKIGSGEKGNWPFIEDIADLGKPLIISTGMWERGDLDQLDDHLQDGTYALLHCVSSYPAKELNLGRIRRLWEYAPVVGYSDHSAQYRIPSVAVALGARIVEMHFHPGIKVPNSNDGKASFSPRKLKATITDLREIENVIGDGTLPPRKEELETMAWALKNVESNQRMTD